MAFFRLLILLLFFQLPILTTEAQEAYDYVVLHDSLIQERFKLIDLASLKGWKFSSRDGENFSSATYDDSEWPVITGPLNEGENLPLNWNGFGWFRLKVKVDSSFSATHSLITAYNSGGLEFYVNDSLVLKRGNPSPLESEEILFGSTIEPGNVFIWEPGKTYQLAVKYSLHDFSSLQGLMNTDSPFEFTIAVYNLENLRYILAEHRGYTIVFASSSILLFLVMILHLSLYMRAKDETGNFWIFLLSFALFTSTALTVLRVSYDFFNFYSDAFISLGVNISIFSSVGLIPLVAHKVLQIKSNIFWKYFTAFPLVILGLIIIAPEILTDRFTGLSVIICALLLAITGGSIAVYKARKQKRRDIYIIAGPILGFPLLFVLGNILFNILEFENTFLEFFLIFLLVTIIPLGFSIYQAKKFLRMHRQLDQMVDERTRELEEAMYNLQKSHSNLKAAQDQLVQQEKLASLGQLTAGIAHEIKNPLNFVTNFSDVCLELIEEAKSELNTLKKTKVYAGNNGIDSTLLENIKELLETVEVNLQKIFQHGNRADGIVKSMLLHSRGGSGQKELTDLNQLVKEYVNLAFHGMRASRNPINVKIELDLDEQIYKIPLITEDFGRVILNLCNNAFDAMKEKINDPDYQAILRVSTHIENYQIKISLEDNGPGIKQENINNILQPFFTTKKGTDGTGLGLSLSNEIVKSHGGEIKFTSVPGTGAIFNIIFPVGNINSKKGLEETEYN